jgi:hypothetical protein
VEQQVGAAAVGAAVQCTRSEQPVGEAGHGLTGETSAEELPSSAVDGDATDPGMGRKDGGKGGGWRRGGGRRRPAGGGQP